MCRIHFRSLTEHFDSDTNHGRFALQVHGAMPEWFLDLNRRRTMEGLVAALARGREGGRPKKLTQAHIEVCRALLQTGTISIAAIAKRLGVSRDTFYSFSQARARSQAAAVGSAGTRRRPAR